MMIGIQVKDGATSQEIAQALRAQADFLAGATKEKRAPAAKAADEEEDDFKAKGVDDGGFDADEEPEEEKPKKSTKAKKITLDEVNDACKAHAGANGREATLAILKKKFKTESVAALKPEQYEACISAMAVD